MVDHTKPDKYSDIDKRLHDDFVRMDEEANQDGLMCGHLPY